jgi:cell division septum initiation protein DivIVA
VKGEPPPTEHSEAAPPDVLDMRGRLARHEEPVSPDLLTASFPITMRGYSREAVDSHIQRLNQVIAELEMNRSPRSAVRHALDRVGEQTAGILRQARGAAEEILASAREEADEITDRAAAEARELIVDASDNADRTAAQAAELLRRSREQADELLADAQEQAERIVALAQAEVDEQRRQLQDELDARRAEAESTMLELRADTEAVWEERHELLAEIRQFADQAKAVASEAVERLPDEADELAEESEPTLEQDTGVMQVAADGEEPGDSGTV